MPLIRKLEEKIQKGFAPLANKRVIVAFSGNQASVVLTHYAKLHSKQIHLATVLSGWNTEEQRNEILFLAESFDLPVQIIQIPKDLLHHTFWGAEERCFLCKIVISSQLIDLASKMSFDVVIDGTNSTEKTNLPVYFQVTKLGVYSPFVTADLSTEEISRIVQELNLGGSVKSPRICLADRFPPGEQISSERLDRLEKAESYLQTLGLQEIQIRSHGDLCRLILNLDLIESLRKKSTLDHVVDHLKSIGFKWVTLDLGDSST